MSLTDRGQSLWGPLSGRVVYQWTTRADGVVENLCVRESTLNDPKTESCVLRVIEQIRFPAAENSSVIVHPLFFQTK